MKIFGCNPKTLTQVIQDFVGASHNVHEDSCKGGYVVLHPCKEGCYLEGTKTWFFVWNTIEKDINYDDLEKTLNKETGRPIRIAVFKHIGEAFTVSHEGGIGIAHGGGNEDLIVVFKN